MRTRDASTIAELAEALTKDTDSTADIYTLTHGALAALAHGQHVPQRILTRYLARSMNAAGWPLIGENCTRCGNPLVSADSQSDNRADSSTPALQAEAMADTLPSTPPTPTGTTPSSAPNAHPPPTRL